LTSVLYTVVLKGQFIRYRLSEYLWHSGALTTYINQESQQ